MIVPNFHFYAHFMLCFDNHPVLMKTKTGSKNYYMKKTNHPILYHYCKRNDLMIKNPIEPKRMRRNIGKSQVSKTTSRP